MRSHFTTVPNGKGAKKAASTSGGKDYSASPEHKKANTGMKDALMEVEAPEDQFNEEGWFSTNVLDDFDDKDDDGPQDDPKDAADVTEPNGGTNEPAAAKTNDATKDTDTTKTTKMTEATDNDNNNDPTNDDPNDTTTTPPDDPGTPKRKGSQSKKQTFAKTGENSKRNAQQSLLATFNRHDGNNNSVVSRGNASRKHKFFAKLVVTVPESYQGTATLWKSLMTAMDVIQEVDPRMVLYPVRSDATTSALVSSKEMPATQTNMQEYADGARPLAKGGNVWTVVRVGFDEDPEIFFQDGNGAMESIGGKLYKAPLQVARTSEEYLLMNSWPGMNTTEWTEWLLPHMNALAEKEGRRKAIQMALVDKKLPKNPATKKKDEGNEKKKKFDAINRAVFIITPKGEEKVVIRYLDKVLKSEEYAQRSGIPLHIIPRANQFASRNTQKKQQKALLKHRKARFSISRGMIYNIEDVDSPMPELDNKTIRDLIMEVKRPTNQLEGAALSIDSKEWGEDKGSLYMSFPKVYESELADIPTYMTAILYHKHGDAVLRKFTPEGVDDALETEWDEENQRPISFKEKMAGDAVDGTAIPWLDPDFKELIESENKEDTARPARGWNIEQDNQSTSTFGFGNAMVTLEGSTKSPSPATFTIATFNEPPAESAVTDDDLTLESAMDGRVADVEAKVSSMQDNIATILTLLQRQGGSSGDPDSGRITAAHPTEVRDPAGATKAPAGRD